MALKPSNLTVPATESKMTKILPGTPEMEALLGSGYGGMTVAEAEEIIDRRSKDPNSYPYDVLKRAQAFMAAYQATPVAIDTKPGWHRTNRKPREEE